MEFIREITKSQQYEEYLDYLAEKEDEIYEDKVFEEIHKESEKNGRTEV